MEELIHARLAALAMELTETARLKKEQGAAGVYELTEQMLADGLAQVEALPDDPALAAREPDGHEAILACREAGPRRLWTELPPETELLEKLEGALLARITGCLLGVPVEGWSMERIEGMCRVYGLEFPPTDYWEHIEGAFDRNVYGRLRDDYRKSRMREAPVDDDIIYTQLGLLILERFGPDFTTAQAGGAWKELLPFGCTAEGAALANLAAGLPTEQLALVKNPYRQWIGAAIRSDGFAFGAPGYPEKAAAMAYREGYLSHRRGGLYGEMFLAAAQSAAFAVADPMEAVRIGLTEIPQGCLLHGDLTWALAECQNVKDYRDAVRLVRGRFPDMHNVHTNNNLCLVVFGLHIGRGDVRKTLSELVAMGMDNDCTAASAGSIVGAIAGKRGVPPELYELFHDTVDTYLLDTPKFRISDMARRFAAVAKRVYESA